MTLATETAIRLAGHEGLDPAIVRHRQRSGSAGLFRAGRARARHRSRLSVRQADHARHPRRLRQEPPRHRHRLSRHRQIDPYRAGRGAAQLALRARQSRQPHQPRRSHRQGCHRHPRGHAGHRVPRRHPAVGAAAQCRAVLRRIRRRPPRRDVRDPARAGIVRPADAARPEQGDQAASGVPPVRDRQYGRSRRHVRPLSRHPADQPGPDGPLVDRHHAELSAARQRGRDRARQGASTIATPKAATSSARWCGWPISPATPS